MTSEEVAQWICNHIAAVRPEYGPEDVAGIAWAVEEAIKREREQCARLAESTTIGIIDYRGWSPGRAADERSHIIAAMIRAQDTGDGN